MSVVQQSSGLQVMVYWPARSPNLNPIENVGGSLAKRVYMNNRQFSSVRDLTNCVFNKWKELPHSLLKNAFRFNAETLY